MEAHLCNIFTWIKNNILTYQQQIQPTESNSPSKTVINSKKESTSSCSNFTKVLVTVGFFASVAVISVGVFLNDEYHQP